MKKLFASFFGTVVLLLLFIGGFNLAVDSFYHYHAPAEGVSVCMKNQVYQTPGAALHFTYDSAVVGTSMTENFRVSWFGEMGLNTVKLSYSGAHSADIRNVLDKIYESDNEIKYIFMDMNDYQLTTDSEERFAETPAYLYENEWYYDAEYLLNNDVFWMSVGRVLETLTGNQPNLDDAYTWEDPELFGEEKVRECYRRDMENLLQESESGDVKAFEESEEYRMCEDNLENIIPVIEAHPETEYIVFYPPYSILYWEEQVVSGRLTRILEIYKYSIERLLPYENVRVFYFQDEEEMITNLDNYRDLCHYTPQINRYIFECIRDGEKEITAENLEEHFANMYKIAAEYPHDEI